MYVKSSLSVERLKEVLDYDSISGTFTWKVDKGRNKCKGKKAGRKTNVGYITIKIDYIEYTAHRLAWLYTYGKWPKYILDHINRNPLDNSISNLREATISQNGANSKLPINNTSGYRGITKVGKSWQAQISYNSKTIYLGRYRSKEEAYAAYSKKRQELFHEFA